MDVKAFQELVKQGDLGGVQSALAAEPELLDATNTAGQGAFLLAKYYRQEALADYLLTRHPKLDLFNLCVAGQVEPVLAGIERDSTLLEAHSGDGWTPLHLAAFFGHRGLAQALINHGAQVDSRSTNAMVNTPLHAAAAGGKTALVELLLQNGASVNAKQEGGWTALHAAAQSGDREMVEVLLANGAEASARAANNQAPLDLALQKGHQEIAALLEGLGAKLQ
jgi:ankyrin repeat protein